MISSSKEEAHTVVRVKIMIFKDAEPGSVCIKTLAGLVWNVYLCLQIN